MPGEEAPDAGLTMEEEISRVMKLALDTLRQELQDRSKRLHDHFFRLGFLLEVDSLLGESMKLDEILRHCVDVGITYEGDVDGRSFYDEILDCRMLFKKRHNRAVPPPVSPEELLQATVEYGKDVFPNLRTALQILLTMSVSVASCERSFSKLKLIKNWLRSTMSQEGLSNLAILSIEKEVVESSEVDVIIDNFAEKKSCKVKM